MNRQYIWKKADGYSKPTGLAAHMAVATTKVVSGRGPFTLSQDGDAIGGDYSRVEVLSRYKTAISHRELASTFRIRKGNGDVVFTGRAVKDAPDEIDTSGNHNSDAFWTWIVSEYKAFHPRFAGSYVCKHVSGTWTLSQHSYGNAVDVFFDTVAHQEKVFDDIRNGKCPVRVCHAISLRRIWEPSSGTSGYGGDTHYHLHTDFCPQCSGGCGVRNC